MLRQFSAFIDHEKVRCRIIFLFCFAEISGQVACSEPDICLNCFKIRNTPKVLVNSLYFSAFRHALCNCILKFSRLKYASSHMSRVKM